MKDLVTVTVVVLAFATLVTSHLSIVFGLLRKPPRSRALLALVVAPLAPYWAFRERMRVRAGVWAVAAVLYVAARVIASV